MKILSECEKQKISLFEEISLKYPEGRNIAEHFWEPFIAEGTIENILHLDDSFKEIKDVEIINLNDYQNHSKEVFKLLPDEYGIDEVYWNHQTNDNEIIFSFSWNQIKIGYSDNYLNENEISLLENNEILEKLQVLQNSISDKIRSKYKENFNFIKINHKTNIITTKKFSKKNSKQP